MEYDLKILKINKNKIEQLNEMAIYTVKDLVQHYPYRFEEMLETPLHDETKVIIEAQLIDEPKLFYKGRFSRLTFHVNYHEEQLTITIFNRHFLKKNMQVGMMLTIIGIPFGMQTLKLAGLALWPFGKEVRSGNRSSGCLYILMNILWIFLGGIWICLSHLVFGAILCITIIGIPFGLQHFKLAALALSPFGKDIITV